MQWDRLWKKWASQGDIENFVNRMNKDLSVWEENRIFELERKKLEELNEQWKMFQPAIKSWKYYETHVSWKSQSWMSSSHITESPEWDPESHVNVFNRLFADSM